MNLCKLYNYDCLLQKIKLIYMKIYFKYEALSYFYKIWLSIDAFRNSLSFTSI